jgi:hypothetical protein
MLNAKNLHTYLAKVFYKRRSEFNPLWNHVLVAGFDVGNVTAKANHCLIAEITQTLHVGETSQGSVGGLAVTFPTCNISTVS